MKKILTAILTVTLYSCGIREVDNIIYLKQSDMPSPELVSIDTLDVPCVMDPTRVYCFGNKILMKDNSSRECQMYVFEPRSKELTRSLRIGRGPGETIGAFYFAMILPDSLIVVNDVVLRRMLEIPLERLDYDWASPVNTSASVVGGADARALCGYENNDLLVLGEYQDARFVIYDIADTTVLQKIVYSPDPVTKKTGAQVSAAYEGVIKYNPDRKKSVIACRYADQLEFYDFNTDKVLFIKGPESFDPSYISKTSSVTGAKTIAHKSDEKKGYLDVCCDGNRVYALYSGLPLVDPNSSYGREIRIFDWKGNLRKTLQTDVDIISIDIDENGTLYCLTIDGHLSECPV